MSIRPDVAASCRTSSARARVDQHHGEFILGTDDRSRGADVDAFADKTVA
jgi:hypothetical protein